MKVEEELWRCLKSTFKAELRPKCRLLLPAPPYHLPALPYSRQIYHLTLFEIFHIQLYPPPPLLSFFFNLASTERQRHCTRSHTTIASHSTTAAPLPPPPPPLLVFQLLTSHLAWFTIIFHLRLVKTVPIIFKFHHFGTHSSN